MARKTDLAGGKKDADGAFLASFLADETELDKRVLLRLGAWGVAAVGAVTVALVANQSANSWRRDQSAVLEFGRQANQAQLLARESQNEARRLASALDVLNQDRDRLYTRVTVLEQNLDSVTGAIAKQAGTGPGPSTTANAPQTPPPQPPAGGSAGAAAPAASRTAVAAPESGLPTAPVITTPPPVAPVATVSPAPAAPPKPEAATASAEPLAAAALPKIAAVNPTQAPVAAKPSVAASEPTTTKPSEAAKPAEPSTGREPQKPAKSTEPAAADVTPKAIQKTEFAVDLGSASSLGGLRALWRGLVKSHAELKTLRPIVIVKERNTGAGMQLRLAAGPIMDAAAAAKICARLQDDERDCDTTVFDGQRLSLRDDEVAQPPAAAPPPPAKPSSRRRGAERPQRVAAPEPPKPPPEPPSALSTLFGRR